MPDAPSNPGPSPAAGGPPVGGWRLPVRIRVPERDELLAMALATLAVGLVLGLAIGPGLGTAGRVLPVISAPLAQLPITPEVSDESSPETTLPVLAAPAGSDPGAAPIPLAPAPVTLAAVPVTPEAPPDPAPASPSPSSSPAPPDTPDPAPPAVPDGLPISGTVLASSVNGKSFSVADSSGNLQTVFSDFPPEPGARISTTVLPLVNGTFSEYGGRRTLATRERATVRGMISYVDAELGVLVLSNRGTSLPLDGSAVANELVPPSNPVDPEALPPLGDGDWVKVSLVLVDPELKQASENRGAFAAAADLEPSPEKLNADPDPATGRPDFGLRIESLERLDETATRIELTGKLLTLDRRAGRLLMSADSVGLLDRTIEITTPSGFDFSGVKKGRVYSATVRLTAAGELRLTGFSPGYSGRAADDRTEVFGEQGF